MAGKRKYRIVFILLFILSGWQGACGSLSAQNLFLENGGRLPSFVTYTRQTGAGMVYYTRDGLSMLMKDCRQYDSLWEHIHRHKSLKKDFSVRWHRYDLRLRGGLGSMPEARYESPTRYHFYKGADRSRKTINLREYHHLLYKNIYPETDWLVEAYGQAIKHNFVLRPGASAAAIRMEYRHTDGMEIDGGSLRIRTSVGSVNEEKPYAFQIIRGDTIPVLCEYTLEKEGDVYVAGFRLGSYDTAHTLLIDPVLVFSTYSGSQGDNFGFTATYDSKARLYAGGIVDGGTGSNGGDFPVTPGAFQTFYAGGSGQAPANLPCDIGINKYDSAGNTLLYSTYLGGSRDEYPHSLVADHNDRLLIMGTSYSDDFPVDPNGFDPVFNGGTDLFVFKLSEDGSAMLGGTFIGGSGNDGLNTRTLRYNYSDDFRGDIVVDTANNVYVASTTNSIDFPLKNALQNSRASAQDACVFSLDSQLSQLRFSTYLGGNGDDAMYSIRLNDTFVLAGGGTASSAMSFPVNGHKNSFGGGRADGFIARLNLGGSLSSSTYFGTADYDQIYFLDIDASGQVYAAGQTEGNLNRTPGTYGKDNTGQFIVRYAPNISLINLSTTFGNRLNNPEISPSAFLVDKCDNIYFSGWGSPIDYDGLHSLTTAGLQVSPDAIQKTTDNNDFYLMVMSRNASSLLHATFFGGNRTEDHVDGGTSRFDKKGVVYQSVCSSCPEPGAHYDDFPVSPNAPFTKNLSPRCSNASFKIDFQINFEVDARFSAFPQAGCRPLLVNFTNLSRKARQYFWDFGDGSPVDTARNPVHNYQTPGMYKVMLRCVDSFSCNLSAVDSTWIEVKETPLADFSFSTETCSREVRFKNLSKDFSDPEWDFGDTSGINKDNDPSHRFEKDGNFRVLLKVKHPVSGCTDTQTALIPMFGDPLRSIKIPNVFTPNNDNKNECYTIGGISPGCDEAEIWIYNRWGEKIFHGMLPEQCWNGSVENNGELAPDGTYYYILKLRSKNPAIPNEESFEGVIRVIR